MYIGYWTLNKYYYYNTTHMEVDYHSLHSRTQQRHIQGHRIQAHILHLNKCTLEKSLLPYITANIPNTQTQHGYKTQHSTVTALHTVNNSVAKGFNQMDPPARTITVALDMSKAFDTINIHTHIKLLHTKITRPNH